MPPLWRAPGARLRRRPDADGTALLHQFLVVAAGPVRGLNGVTPRPRPPLPSSGAGAFCASGAGALRVQCPQEADMAARGVRFLASDIWDAPDNDKRYEV